MDNTIRFHRTHGDDVAVTNNYTTARRFAATHTGLVFTSQPLRPCQKFSIKLTEICDKSKNVIDVGFTTQSPTQNYRPHPFHHQTVQLSQASLHQGQSDVLLRDQEREGPL
jgi:hypothetical protein